VNQYKALRTLSLIYLVLAGLVLTASVMYGGSKMIMPSVSYNYVTGSIEQSAPAVGAGIVILLSGVLTAITLAAFGQLLQIVLEMLENSREQTGYMRLLARKEMTATKSKKDN